MRLFLWFTPLLFLLATAQTPAPTEIIFWHYSPPQAEGWAALAAAFSAESGIAITVQHYPSHIQQHDALLRALVDGTPPDAALMDATDAALYALGGALLSDETTLAHHAETLYVNLDALHQAGYATPPQNWDELAVQACAFDGVGFDLHMDAAFFWALAHPAPFFDGAQFDFSGLEHPLAFLRDLLARGCAVVPAQANPLARFASGQTLFYFDTSAALPYVQNAIGDYFAQPFALGVAAVPTQTGTVALWQETRLGVFHSTPQREAAALAWARWLAQPPQAAQVAALSGGLRTSDNLPPPWESFAAAASAAEPSFAGYDLVRDELVFAVRGIFNGEDRLAALSQTANQIYAAFMIESD